ncbi:MAG TPA: ABC transporter substrate-binding protein [Pseudolabrys sp.]|nr:ABC transporter substrate-binding protein [Pseudolabrys sp.]
MRKPMMLRLRLAALAAAGVIMCAVPANAQDQVWRHGLIKAKADAGIFMMVTTRDFAKKQGLDLKVSQFRNDQIALKALLAGQLDSYEGGPQGVFAADARGADVRILGCHWLVVPHGIYAVDSIKKVTDLKGKSIAVSAPNSMPDMLARFALEKYGLSPKDVKLAAVGGDRDRYNALIAGVVQAAVVSNEYQPVMPKSIHLLLAGRDAMPKFLRVCLMTSQKVLDKKGKEAAHFLAAEMNALHYALSHKAETVALTEEIIHSKPGDPRPAFVYDDAVKHDAVDPSLPLPMDKLAWLQQQLIKAGTLKKPLGLKTVTAPKYREEALKMAAGR